MKSLLMGAIILFLFSISLIIVQTSCSKTEAQSPGAVSQINKLIYTNFNNEMWISNYDGSGATQVNLALPPNVFLNTSMPRFSVKMSPDGQKIFFSGINTATTETGIYSCDVSGNNVAPVLVSTGGTQPILCGAY